MHLSHIQQYSFQNKNVHNCILNGVLWDMRLYFINHIYYISVVVAPKMVPGCGIMLLHDDIIKWKHFSRYWPFVRGIHRSPVNSPHKGQ